MSYWDTSCIIKLYTPEPDSLLFREFLEKGDTCVTCDLTPLEFWATVRRKESEGVLSSGEALKVQTALEADLAEEAILMKTCDAAVKARYHMIVDQCHSRVPPIFIRTNDAKR